MSTSFNNSENALLAAEEAQALEQDGAQANAHEVAQAKPAAGDMLRPFKVRNFSLLFGGQTISTIGDMLYMVALPWLILTTGGSPQELGAVLAVYGIPRAFSMLAGGWLSDRLRPRRLMLIADSIRMVLVGLLAVLALGGHPAFWQLCALALPLGILSGVFMPAAMSILPDTLNNEELQAGNALIMSATQGANLVGSAAAGLIVAAFTSATGLAIDAATFLVSTVSLALMTAPRQVATSKQKGDEGQESAQTPEAQISFGRFLLNSRLIQVILLVFVIIGISSGGLVEVALPTLVHGPMHGGANSFGFIMAAWGAGSLVGGVFAGMLGKLKQKGLIIFLAGLVVSAALALIPFGGIFGAIVCMLIGGLANSNITVLLFTAIQLAIPRHLMGRVMGLLMFSSFGLYPVSVALAGVLSNQLGPVILFPIGGLLLVLALLIGISQKAFRQL